jgi:hypothetical protein
MKPLLRLILVIVLVLFIPTLFASNKEAIPLSQIRVAQFNYAQQYVNGLDIQYKNNSPKQNQAILDKMQFPIVISPDQKLYLENDIEQLVVFNKLSVITNHSYQLYFKITKKFAVDNSQYATQQFWQWMKNTNKINLTDQGVNKSFTQLPVNIKEMNNDSYLSLAKWLAESHWCYQSNQNNTEYIWANYFRDLVSEGQLAMYSDLNPTTIKGLKAKNSYINYIKRVGVCHVNVADKLPGFCQYDQGCSVWGSHPS